MGQAWLLCALSNAYRRLVKHDVDVPHGVSYDAGITDVPFNNNDITMLTRPRQVLAPPPDKIVEDDNLLHVFGDQLVGNVRTDQPRTSRNQNPTASNHRAISRNW